MVGTNLGQYSILAKLGEGGMGKVYLARDTRLDRKVALKLLPAELAEDPDRRSRLEHEARILASVSHPGIVTVYSVEESGGRLFITMEYVDGTPLNLVIAEGPLTADRFFAVAAELADALAAAHARGISHRDLKPANVILTNEGHSKILDFGLATAPLGDAEQQIEQALTLAEADAAGLLGSPPYMAPEQVRGEPGDHRCDIHALGAILYEMASGERPFRGSSLPELVSSILRDRPRRLSALRPGLPPQLDWLIERCLEKEPNRRLQSALDLRNLLEQARDEPATVDNRLRSIAVLPLIDLSPAHDQDYFCDGIAEELINALTRIEDLRVPSRASSFQFRGSGLDLREIGRSLNVAFVLEGSVRKSGDQLRITVELVKVADGYNLWSKRYDRKLEDIFAIQDEITRATVEALELTLEPKALLSIERRPTTSLDAYDFYLRGRKYFNQYRRRGMEFALEMFSRAIELDSEYALAWAGIADCCAYLYANAERSEEFLHRALEAGDKAIRIDPELAEAHVARALSLSYSGRKEEAAASFETALHLNPGLFEAEYFYARHCFAAGERDNALLHYERAAELQPTDYQGPLLAAQTYEDLGRLEEATAVRERGVRLAQRRLRTTPDDTRALYMAGNALVALGKREEGLDCARRAQRLEPDEPMLLYNVACIYSMAGCLDEAIDCLTTCFRHGFSYIDWAEHDSNIDAIRNHPQYLELIEDARKAKAETRA